MTAHTFIVNGSTVTLDVHPDVRVLWVLRDLLKVTGPKYGCGINVCKACTSHINGRAFNPCSVKVSDLKPLDRVDTIEGLPAQAGLSEGRLHPMQQAWIDRDVAQCGYCQPGQIMAAVALVRKVRREGREITERDLDNIRNICRCGTYTRIREAILQGAAAMAALPTQTPGAGDGATPGAGAATGGAAGGTGAGKKAKKRKKRKKPAERTGAHVEHDRKAQRRHKAGHDVLNPVAAAFDDVPGGLPLAAAAVGAVAAADVVRRARSRPAAAVPNDPVEDEPADDTPSN